MPSQLPPELQRRVSEATDLLRQAEKELGAALQALTPEARAEKRMMSERLEGAFEALATAKSRLEALQEAPES
jgi:hypothetical protein